MQQHKTQELQNSIPPHHRMLSTAASGFYPRVKNGRTRNSGTRPSYEWRSAVLAPAPDAQPAAPRAVVSPPPPQLKLRESQERLAPKTRAHHRRLLGAHRAGARLAEPKGAGAAQPARHGAAHVPRQVCGAVQRPHPPLEQRHAAHRHLPAARSRGQQRRQQQEVRRRGAGATRNQEQNWQDRGRIPLVTESLPRSTARLCARSQHAYATYHDGHEALDSLPPGLHACIHSPGMQGSPPSAQGGRGAAPAAPCRATVLR